MVPIYIEVEDGLRLSRALERERGQQHPKYREMCRRFLADEQDFSQEKLAKAEIDRRFVNEEADRTQEEIASYIMSLRPDIVEKKTERRQRVWKSRKKRRFPPLWGWRI